ncbi:hypothetical protein GCM10025771_06230 [Niveibacterium umoris]|uniref:Uncharacterized protein n=1 Tax=Niveibacterium umoris TaxID=1193620 RepID=A0A840BQT8_9RHOO|nr:hypothetical protein [Niveibacterium umoris]MBB4013829.1 hypothetical protein [Niveibacterium umoris]
MPQPIIVEAATIPRRPSAEVTYRLFAYGVGVPFALGRRIMRGPRVPDLVPVASTAVRVGLSPFFFAALVGWRVQSACLRAVLKGTSRSTPGR